VKCMVIIAMLYCIPYASLATFKSSKGSVHTVSIQEVSKKHKDASRCPKTVQDASNMGPRRSKMHQDASKTLQDESRTFP
jgi:hypothetical protein